MDPCFGEEIFSAFEAAAELDRADVGELATLGGRRDLEGDAPAGVGNRLDGDALDFDFIGTGAAGLDERRERNFALLVEGVADELDHHGALFGLPVVDAGTGGDHAPIGHRRATVLSESSLVVGISINITRPGPQSEVGSIHSEGRS